MVSETSYLPLFIMKNIRSIIRQRFNDTRIVFYEPLSGMDELIIRLDATDAIEFQIRDIIPHPSTEIWYYD